MNSVFQDKNPSVENARIEAEMRYNRRRRRKGLFVIMDKKGRFGRWNKETKAVNFKHFEDLITVPLYSWKNIVMMWQLDGMKNDRMIRMMVKDQNGDLIVI